MTLNDRQDYFGQTVNIASRVQNLAVSSSIFASAAVVAHPEVSQLLETAGRAPTHQIHALRGVAGNVTVYEIP